MARDKAYNEAEKKDEETVCAERHYSILLTKDGNHLADDYRIQIS